MSQIKKDIISNSIKIGKIVKVAKDHVMVEYDAGEVSEIMTDDMIDEFCPLLQSGMKVELFDEEGNFFSNDDRFIHARVAF